MQKQRTERARLWAYGPFRRFIAGSTISWLGTSMQFLANSWLAMDLTGKSSSVGLILAAAALPGILLSPVVGAAVDRLDRRRLAALMDLFRALVLLGVPLLWWTGALQPWHLYASTFLVAIGDEIFKPAAQALLREVVPADLLLPANAADQAALQIGLLSGSALGGFVMALTSPLAVTVLNAASFLISGACILSMRRGRVLPQTGGATQGWRVVLASLGEGVAYTRQHPRIIGPYAIFLFLMTTVFAINALLAPFARHVLNAGAEAFGLIDAAFSVGALAGSAVLVSFTRRWGEKPVMVVGLAGLGASLIAFASAQSLPAALAGYLLIGLTIQVRILFGTRVQALIALPYQGRVHAAFNLVFSTVLLAVFLLLGFAGEGLSQRWLYGGWGAVVLVVTLLAARTKIRPAAQDLQVSC